MILLIPALAWTAGVLLCALVGPAAWPLVLAASLAFGAGLAYRGVRRPAVFAVVVGVVAVLGMLRYGAALPDVQHGISLENDRGADSVLRGLVTDVQERERVRLVRVQAEAIQRAEDTWQATSGDVLLTLPLYPERRYGDQVVVTGELETPVQFDGFDYRAYLERQGIGSVMLYPRVAVSGTGGGNWATAILLTVRERLSRSIELSMREPEASIAKGMLLGLRGSIPADLGDDFNESGLSHLIVISGQNMMLVASLVAALLWPLIGRRPATVFAIVVVILYAVLVGGSPPVVRATIMAAIVLGASLSGREGWTLRALAIAAALMLAVEPGQVTDVSFQLSVFATTGIIVGAGPIEVILRRLPGGFFATGFGRWVAEQMSITGSASLAVMPVMALAFGRVSLAALPANLIAAPLFSWMLAGSFVTSLTGLIDRDAAWAVGLVARVPLSWFVSLARGFAGLPLASVEAGPVLAGVVAAAIWACVYLLSRGSADVEEPQGERERQQRLQVVYAAVIAAGLAVAVWQPLIEGANDRLRMTMLDVGQGDAILIETPGGRVVLVDGGPSGSRLLNQLATALPPGRRRIDLVVLTHGQDDHVSGLIEVLERYEVGAVLMSDRPGSSGAAQEWAHRVEQLGVPVVLAARGMEAELAGGVLLKVLHPHRDDVAGGDDANENSVVLKLVYDEVSMLLTGDIGFAAEDALLAAGAELRSTVLKVGHHGSDGSTSARFLDAVAPELALISVGEENTYGHPSPTTRLRLAGIKVARTDLNGRIRLETDGTRLWLDLEHGAHQLVPAGLSQK